VRPRVVRPGRHRVPAPAAAQDGPYYPVPSWDQTIRGSKRFVLVMPIEGHGFQAVLDRETGLVWQRVPNEPRAYEWLAARTLCRFENTGGRQGWRLPSIEELSSLLDLSSPTAVSPGLPTGHPFDLREGSPYFWSASVDDMNATFAYAVTFVGEQPSVVPGARVFPKEFKLRAWCVRGGQGDHP
jgi:Protein of unknown function (DUF1566)